MLKNYLSTAWRVLLRYRFYSLVNTTGLVLGLVSGLLVLATLLFELGFDRQNPASDRIYRILQHDLEEKDHWTWVPGRMTETLKEDYSQIEQTLRIAGLTGVMSTGQEADDTRLSQEGIRCADPTFFNFFPQQAIEGNLDLVLKGKYNVVLTRTAAEKYFGTVHCTGKQLYFNEQKELTVAAVVEDPAKNSSEQFEVLATYEFFLEVRYVRDLNSWWWPNNTAYVMLHNAEQGKAFNDGELASFIARYREKEEAERWVPMFQPIHEMRLAGSYDNNGRADFIAILSALGIFIVLIACINYINLATARAGQRAKEVGVRKTLGAGRRQLALQFLTESFLLTTVSFLLAYGIASLALPYFGRITGTDPSVVWGSPELLYAGVGLFVFVLLAAGAYPAFVLSGFNPLKVLSFQRAQGRGAAWLRKVLVVSQFAISAVLLIAAIVISQQTDHLLTRDQGFAVERIVVIDAQNQSDVAKDYKNFKEYLKTQPGVAGVTAANWAPGGSGTVFPAEVGEVSTNPNILYVDADFLETMGIELKAGRTFNPNSEEDKKTTFLLNEAAMDFYGLEDGPRQQPISMGYGENGETVYEKNGYVEGVVSNFNVLSAHNMIGPTVINHFDEVDGAYNQLGVIFVRFDNSNYAEINTLLDEAWGRYFPYIPIEAYYMNDIIDAQFADEQTLVEQILLFTGLATLISCLGLLGLAAFSASRRAKEVSIRRVFGATAANIGMLFTRQFGGLLLVAFVLAAPLGYYLMTSWLEAFPYKVGLSPLVFLGAFVGLVVLSLVSISLPVRRALKTNPSEVLRDE